MGQYLVNLLEGRATLVHLMGIEDPHQRAARIVVKRARREEREEERRKRRNRFCRSPAMFSPAPFAARPVSAGGRTSFHFDVSHVYKGPRGTSTIKGTGGEKKGGGSAAADHDVYIARVIAADTIAPRNHDLYIGRPEAVEASEAGTPILFTNISPVQSERCAFWAAVDRHERTPGTDELVFHPDRLSRDGWQLIANSLEVPLEVREVAAGFCDETAGPAMTRDRAAKRLVMPRKEGRAVCRVIRRLVGDTCQRRQPPVRVSEARGGRTQVRFVAEFPPSLDAGDHAEIVQQFCAPFDQRGLRYTGVVHAPDHHNHETNFHFHLDIYDRPTVRMDNGQWDFEVEEPGSKKGRVSHPHRQKKVPLFPSAAAGQRRLEQAECEIAALRATWAQLCNDKLVERGLAPRFDPRTYEKMGIDQEPTEHMGNRAFALEIAGIPTELGTRNAEKIWSARLKWAVSAAQKVVDTAQLLRQRLVRTLEPARAIAAPVHASRLDAILVESEKALALIAEAVPALAEFDVLVELAKARPKRVAETCTRILDAIQRGQASRSDKKSGPDIARRLQEAEDALRHIADLVRASATEQVRAIVNEASATLTRLDREAGTLVEQIRRQASPLFVQAASFSPKTQPSFDGAEGTLAQRPRVLSKGVEQVQVASGTASNPSDADRLEAILTRVLEELPVLAPDDEHDFYRVPGISRSEYELLSAKPYQRWVQRRLAGIYRIQARRVRSAMSWLDNLGAAELERRAEYEPNARRALDSLRLFENHPHLQSARIAEIRADADTAPGRESSSVEQPAAARPAAGEPATTKVVQSGGTTRHGEGQTRQRDLAPNSTAVDSNLAVLSIAANEMSASAAADTRPRRVDPERERTIRAFAAAIPGIDGLQIIRDEGGHLSLVPESAGEWHQWARAFDEEPEVQEALVARYKAEQLARQEVADRELRVRIINFIERSPKRCAHPVQDIWMFTDMPDGLATAAERMMKHPDLVSCFKQHDREWDDRDWETELRARNAEQLERAKSRPVPAAMPDQPQSQLIAAAPATLSPETIGEILRRNGVSR